MCRVIPCNGETLPNYNFHYISMYIEISYTLYNKIMPTISFFGNVIVYFSIYANAHILLLVQQIRDIIDIVLIITTTRPFHY